MITKTTLSNLHYCVTAIKESFNKITDCLTFCQWGSLFVCSVMILAFDHSGRIPFSTSTHSH